MKTRSWNLTKRLVAKMGIAVFTLLLVSFALSGCSGGGSGSDTADETGGGEDGLSVVPPGNEEPSGEGDGADTANPDTESLTQAKTTGLAYVFYQTEDPDGTSTYPECTFIRPFELQVSGSTATFREKAETASTHTITNSLFQADVSDDDDKPYDCRFGLLEENAVVALNCYDYEDYAVRCVATFVVDAETTGQLAKTTFLTSEDADNTALCSDLPAEFDVEITGNRAIMSYDDADGVETSTVSVLSSYKAFRFAYGEDENLEDNAYATLSDKTLAGFADNYAGVGSHCTFEATMKSASPSTSPGGGGEPADDGCTDAQRKFYRPCMH